MTFVDTHCHLDFEAYSEDLEAVLAGAWEAGVERILVPGIDLASSRKVLDLAEKHDRVYAAVGVHPNSAGSWEKGTAAQLEALVEHPKVKAIGEIGLDYYRHRAPREKQREVLQRQLDLADRTHLPVVLHVRNEKKEERSCIIDLLEILAAWKAGIEESRDKHRFGVIHSFSGNVEEAQRAMSLDFFLGITGPVTFKNARVMQQVVTSSPLTCLLIETDGPFLTPHPHRGKRNEPAYVRYVAQKVADLKDRPVGEVARETTENADYLFQWR